MLDVRAKGESAVESLGKYAEELRKQVEKGVDQSVGKTQKAATDVALKLVKLQRKTFDSTFKVIAKVQERSEKAVNDYVKGASWLPAEGKEVVKDWSRMLRDGRADFQKTVDKSYDLVGSYLGRLKKQGAKKPAKKAPARKKKAAPKKKRATKKRAAKKRPAKKKAAAN